MIAVIVNAAAIILGGAAGLILKKGIPEGMGDLIMKGMALCVMYIGISGSLKGENTLIAVLSMLIGAILGYIFRLDDRLNNFADNIEKKTGKENAVKVDSIEKDVEKTRVAEGFVTATLLFCIGAMAIVGSLQAGLSGDYETLFTKSTIDGITAAIFAATLGYGVLLSAIPVFIYEGIIVLISGYAAPYLSEYIIGEMTCVGSLLILAISINMLGLTKIKIMNLMPAIFIPILLCQIM